MVTTGSLPKVVVEVADEDVVEEDSVELLTDDVVADSLEELTDEADADDSAELEVDLSGVAEIVELEVFDTDDNEDDIVVVNELLEELVDLGISWGTAAKHSVGASSPVSITTNCSPSRQ